MRPVPIETTRRPPASVPIAVTCRVAAKQAADESERETTSIIVHGREEEDRRQETMDILSPMRAMARRVLGERHAEGQALVEYSLIFVLIIIVCFTILGTVADDINNNFFEVVAAMP